MSPHHKCPSCQAGVLRIFHTASGVPTNSCILLKTSAEARSYPTGDIALGFCPDCGFISNTAFEAKLTEYSDRYEETQGFSPTFTAFHRELAARLIEDHGLRGKKILEIGCGKGEFLMLLCEMGGNRGLGYDPSYLPERNPSAEAGNVEFVRDFFTADCRDHDADFVCCKMTLEHIPDTARFVRAVRDTLGDNSAARIFFQVPDTTRIIEGCAFEDIYYEHCSYFSADSLARLFRACGFNVDGVNTEYDGQYLTIEAHANGAESIVAERATALSEMTRAVEDFPGKFQAKLNYWREKFAAIQTAGHTAVLWGSGSKGVAFLTTMGLTDQVRCAVDVNPYRHGYFMPGTGHRIVGPDDLPALEPDVVIIMNAIYRPEITASLQERGLTPEILTL